MLVARHSSFFSHLIYSLFFISCFRIEPSLSMTLAAAISFIGYSNIGPAYSMSKNCSNIWLFQKEWFVTNPINKIMM